MEGKDKGKAIVEGVKVKEGGGGRVVIEFDDFEMDTNDGQVLLHERLINMKG